MFLKCLRNVKVGKIFSNLAFSAIDGILLAVPAKNFYIIKKIFSEEYLTISILRDMMYYTRGGIVWIFS